jgi:hypothetical protein
MGSAVVRKSELGVGINCQGHCQSHCLRRWTARLQRTASEMVVSDGWRSVA